MDGLTSYVTALQPTVCWHYLKLRDPTGTQGDRLLRRRRKWKVVMVFSQASRRDSVCIETPVVTSRQDTQAHARGSLRRHWVRWRATAGGHYECPLGTCRDPQPADPGDPSLCSQSPAVIPACCCFASSGVTGTSPFSNLVAHSMLWWQISPDFLIVQPQVCFGGIQCPAKQWARVWQAIV